MLAGTAAPIMLACTGSIAAVCVTEAAASSLAGTDMALRATGCAFTNVSRETIVTPPATARFAYVILSRLLFMVTALYAFAILLISTWVPVRFTRFI